MEVVCKGRSDFGSNGRFNTYMQGVGALHHIVLPVVRSPVRGLEWEDYANKE